MDDFEIISKIGQGSFSSVFKVKRLIDNNIYALKKVNLNNLDEKQKNYALNEIRILASIKSNYIIKYKQSFFDNTDNTLNIVTEFADCGDLSQKISDHRANSTHFTEKEIWKIFIQIVRGLKLLHEMNIVHRDLKSENIFLFSNNKVKIGDLNISTIIKNNFIYTHVGTPKYASPEVWKDLPYDNKSDIWSLGCILYEMMMLDFPFKGKTNKELFDKISNCDCNYDNINLLYSNDLIKITQLLLQKSSDSRPSCDQILKHPLVKKNCNLDDENIKNNNNASCSILETIYIPKNMLLLSNELPKSNYDKQSNNFKKSNKFNNKREFSSYKNLKIKNGKLNGIFSHNNNNIVVKNSRNKHFKLYDLAKISDKLKINYYKNEKKYYTKNNNNLIIKNNQMLIDSQSTKNSMNQICFHMNYKLSPIKSKKNTISKNDFLTKKKSAIINCNVLHNSTKKFESKCTSNKLPIFNCEQKSIYKTMNKNNEKEELNKNSIIKLSKEVSYRKKLRPINFKSSLDSSF